MDNTKSYATEDIKELKQRIATYRNSLTTLKTGLSLDDFLSIKENFNTSTTQFFHVDNSIDTMKKLSEETSTTSDERENEEPIAPLVKKIELHSNEEAKTETPSYGQLKRITNRVQRPEIPNHLTSPSPNNNQKQQIHKRPTSKPTFPHIDAYPNRVNNEHNSQHTSIRLSKTKNSNVNIAIPINKIEATNYFHNHPLEKEVEVDKDIEVSHEIPEPINETSIEQSNDKDFFSRFNIFQKRKKE